MVNATPAQGITTVMLRNVPKKYNAWELVYELERFTARSAFDFVYTPWDKNSVTNMSYAFVNFCDSNVASVVVRQMEGTPWAGAPNRIIKVKPAHVQDLVVNLQRFHNEVAAKGSVNDSHAPLVLDRGVPVPWNWALGKHYGAYFCRPPPAAAAQCREVWAAGPSAPRPFTGKLCEERRPTAMTSACAEERWPCSIASPLSSTGAGSSGAWSSADSDEDASATGCATESSPSVAGSRLPRAAMAGAFAAVGEGAAALFTDVQEPPEMTASQMQGLAESKRQVKDLLLRLRSLG